MPCSLSSSSLCHPTTPFPNYSSPFPAALVIALNTWSSRPWRPPRAPPRLALSSSGTPAQGAGQLPCRRAGPWRQEPQRLPRSDKKPRSRRGNPPPDTGRPSVVTASPRGSAGARAGGRPALLCRGASLRSPHGRQTRVDKDNDAGKGGSLGSNILSSER